MDFYSVIEKRITVRDFMDKPVEIEKVKKILSAGMKAPTYDHLRDWEFVIITDKSKIKEHISKVPRVNTTDRMANAYVRTLEQMMYDMAMPKQYDMLYNAGCVIFPFFKQTSSLYKSETVSSLNAFASIWCCFENIFLAATAEGLACSMRIPTGSEPEHICTVLQHPKDYIFPCYLGIGYPSLNSEIPEQIQHNIENKIHFNKW